MILPGVGLTPAEEDNNLHTRYRQSGLRWAALASVVLLGCSVAVSGAFAAKRPPSAKASSRLSIICLRQGVPQLVRPDLPPRQLFPPLPDTPVSDFDGAGSVVVATRAGALGVAEPGLPARWIDLREVAGGDFYASLVRLSPAGEDALVAGYNAGGTPPGFRLLRVDIASSKLSPVSLTPHQSPLLLDDIHYSPDGTPYILLRDESLPASKLFALRDGALQKVWDSTKVLPAQTEPWDPGSESEYLSLALADYFPLAKTLTLVVYVLVQEEELVQRAEVWLFDPASGGTTRRFALPNPNPERYFNTSFAVGGDSLYFVRLGGLGQDESAGEPVISVSLHRLDLSSGAGVELMSLSADNAAESPFYKVLLYPESAALALVHGEPPGFRAHLLSFTGVELLPASGLEMESERLLLTTAW